MNRKSMRTLGAVPLAWSLWDDISVGRTVHINCKQSLWSALLGEYRKRLVR